MKRYLTVALFIISFELFAHFPIVVDTASSKGLISQVDFAPLQLGVLPFNAQLYDGRIDTFISVNVLMLAQRSAAISFSLLNGVQNNYFLQGGGAAVMSDQNYFLSFALLNLSKSNFFLQLGIGNLSADSSGMQIGAVNFGSFIQCGLYNIEGKLQIGILNTCSTSGNFQLGLLNYNPRAWVKWMPFCNFSFKSDSEKKVTD